MRSPFPLFGALFGLSLLMLPSPASSGKGKRLLLPDLVPAEGTGGRMFVEELGSQKLLRFDAYFANVGDGPLTLTGRAKKAKKRLPAWQSVRRLGKKPPFKHPIGEFTWQPERVKWSLFPVAEYRLRNEGGQVAAQTKISFCMVDNVRVAPDLPGSPTAGVYVTCPATSRRKSIQIGVSVGWADIYKAEHLGQWIDVTDVPPGDYTLEVEIDPEGRLLEKDRSNNRVTLPVTL
ncbi:MAG: lysyl oxidase family protein [Armatimonadota bacterium]